MSSSKVKHVYNELRDLDISPNSDRGIAILNRVLDAIDILSKAELTELIEELDAELPFIME